MTTKEFSDEFDTLLDSYRVVNSFGNTSSDVSINLDEYEKSVFLTQAQEDLVRNLYNGYNIDSQSFEDTEESRKYLANFIKTSIITDKTTGKTGISTNSVFYTVPDEVLFITYESVKFDNTNTPSYINGKTASVVPVKQDEYFKISTSPYKGPNSKRVLRLDIDLVVVEIISIYGILSYTVRYLAKPNPIILVNLSNGLAINGLTTVTECTMNPILHREILKRAVELAFNSKLQTKTK